MIGFQEFIVLLAGFLTLSIYSFLYKENPLYRFAEHLYVGVSAGYLFARAVNDVLYKKIWDVLVTPDAGVVQDWWMLIPTMLGFMMILKLIPRVSWVSRWAIALVVGGTIGLVMTTRFKADVIQQITGTTKKFEEARPSAAASYDKLKKLNQVRISAKDGSPLNHLALSAQCLTQLDVFLRLQSKELSGKSSFDSEEWARINTAFQDYEMVALKDHTSFAKLAEILESMSSKHRYLPEILRDELSKYERKMLDTILQVNSGGQYSKTVADQIHAYNRGYIERQKRLSDLTLRDASIQEKARKFIIQIRTFAGASHEDFSSANAEDLRSSIINFKDHQKIWSNHWGSLKELVTDFHASADDLKTFNVNEELSKKLGVQSAQKFFEQGDDFLVALSLRQKEAANLLSTDLTKAYGDGLKNLFNAFLMAFGVICILIYFFFSTEHKGGVGVMAKIGIYFLMITFGSSFGYTIMARVSLLIGRMDFLLFDFWTALKGIIGG